MKKLFICLTSILLLSACQRQSSTAVNVQKTIAPPDIVAKLSGPNYASASAQVSSPTSGEGVHTISLTLSVTNNTNAPISVSASTMMNQIFFFDTEKMRFNRENSIQSKKPNFDLGNVNPHETYTGNISAYAFTKGKFDLNFDIFATNNLKTVSNTIQLDFQ